MSDIQLKESTPPVREVLKHITALDGIRGIAILLVLVNHLLWANNQTSSRAMNFIVNLRGAGWLGVDIFFALSGFLITGILFDSLADRRYFRNFYARRVFRIFPLYYGVLAVVLFGFLLSQHATAGNLHQLGLTAIYLQNSSLFLHFTAGPLANLYIGHFWSLAVEEQFYLVWPVLIFLVKDRTRLMWLALGLAAMAPIARMLLLAHGAGDDVYFYTFCRQDSLLSGAWLALAFRGPSRDRVNRLAIIPFVASLAILSGMAWVTGNFAHEGNLLINRMGYTVIAVGAASLIAMSLQGNSLTQRLMNWRFFRYFGKYSYGLYILHPLVGFGVVEYLEAQPFWPSLHAKVLSHVLHFAAVMILTVPLAMLSFHFYEKPFLRLKKYFNYGV